MATNKTTAKRVKLKAFHDTPRDFHADYILLPLGYSYNREFLNVSEGDLMRMGDGKVFPVLRTGILSLRNPATEGLCFARYGITLRSAQRVWKTNAFAQGYGKDALSDEECLIVIYGKKEDEQ